MVQSNNMEKSLLFDYSGIDIRSEFIMWKSNSRIFQSLYSFLRSHFFDLCLIWLHVADPKLINSIAGNVCFFLGPDWSHHDSEVTPEALCWEIQTPAAVDEMDIDQSGIRLKSNDVLILAPFGVPPHALIWARAASPAPPTTPITQPTPSTFFLSHIYGFFLGFQLLVASFSIWILLGSFEPNDNLRKSRVVSLMKWNTKSWPMKQHEKLTSGHMRS